MRKHITDRTIRGLMLLALVLFLLTLGLRFGLQQALLQYQEMSVRETTAPSETREPLLVTEMPAEDAETEAADELQRFESAFEELENMEKGLSGERESSTLKENYTTLMKLWNRQLDDLGECITAKMREEEAEAYIADANAFLVTRNHECMKELGQDKLSVVENIDYLRREVALTRERCRELLKDYRRYLAS